MPGASSGRKKKAAAKGRKRRGWSPKRTAARARARDVDKLVVEIARWMVDGLWSREMLARLAKREDVKPATVEEWSAEAGRMLRVGPDVETYRGINLQRLNDTYASAREAKDRVSAVAEQNKMLGLHAPTKVDVRLEQYEQLTPPALHAKLIEQRARIDEQIARLVEEHPELAPNLIEVSATPADRTEGQDQ